MSAFECPNAATDCGAMCWICPSPELKWADLFGADPDYCDGMDVGEWLDANRGEA